MEGVSAEKLMHFATVMGQEAVIEIRPRAGREEYWASHSG
jgi:hypothetical protein